CPQRRPTRQSIRGARSQTRCTSKSRRRTRIYATELRRLGDDVSSRGEGGGALPQSPRRDSASQRSFGPDRGWLPKRPGADLLSRAMVALPAPVHDAEAPPSMRVLRLLRAHRSVLAGCCLVLLDVVLDGLNERIELIRRGGRGHFCGLAPLAATRGCRTYSGSGMEGHVRRGRMCQSRARG